MTKKTPEEQSEERFDYSVERISWPRETIDQHEQDVDLMRQGFAICIREKVEPLEAELEQKTAENVRLRALVQRLVNALYVEEDGFGKVDEEGNFITTVNAFAAAKQEGFVPTNTQDNGAG